MAVSASAPAPTMNPLALLDPRAAAKQAQTKQPSPAKPSSSLNREDSTEHSHGKMIENLYKVEKRSDQPATKRAKIRHDADADDEDYVNYVDVQPKPKSQHAPLGGGGQMGDYLREQREQADAGPEAVIDLTNDNDNDNDSDIVIVRQDSLAEVCLGCIRNARVNAFKVPHPRKTSTFTFVKTHWPWLSVQLRRRPGSNNVIGVLDAESKEFGMIDPRTASCLASIMDGAATTNVRLSARLEPRVKKPFDYPGQAVSDTYALGINVYAPRKYVRGIGTWLSKNQIWLADPTFVEAGIEIVNPHTPKDYTPKQRTVAATTRGTAVIVQRTVEETRLEVFRVFDSIAESKDLPEVEQPKIVKTPLMAHQKQALFFAYTRESLPTGVEAPEEKEGIWTKRVRKDGHFRWRNAITGHEVTTEPPPLLGGILADVMGLGKTLTILALVAGSLPQARAFSQQDLPPGADGSLEYQSGATLLVCPLSTVYNWEDQIKMHLKSKSLKCVVYQGSTRTNDAADLADADLVLTTYSTVAIELARNSASRPNKPLFEINWFRIALDEGHQIRNTQSIQSKACCALAGERRWCITGTPVQNRLEDLGALIKYISTPLRTGDAEAIPKLRVLVDSITLRRLKDMVDLPERNEMIVTLDMNDAERNLYDSFSRDINAKVDAMAGKNQRLGGKAYAQVLKAISRLRRLCAHGGDMLSDDDWELARGFDPSHVIDVEEDGDAPDRGPAAVFDMYRLMKDANVASCAECSAAIEPPGEDELEDDDAAADRPFGHMTPCNQVLCPKCIASWRERTSADAGPDNRGTCAVCGMYVRVTSVALTAREYAKDADARENIANGKLRMSLSRYAGPHTKTRALLADLATQAESSASHPDQPPHKSVVFSEWTSHLDLIQHALANEHIRFVRLDGSMVLKDRKVALSTFESDASVNVILVSIKAGGLGLNLTAANHVFVMEPNYNPAAEQQAIERVHRLGQKRAVTIKRFIMAHSIEGKVLELQRKKIELATFSVDRDSIRQHEEKDRAARMRQTLEELRSLLR